MTSIAKSLRVKKSTDSVLLYIASPAGKETVEAYFSKLHGAVPSYTGFLSSMKIGTGTTKEGVKFDSIFVNREVITKSLKEMYSFSE